VHYPGDVLVLLDVLVELDALYEGGGTVADTGNGYLDDRFSSSNGARVNNRLRRYPFKGFPEKMCGLGQCLLNDTEDYLDHLLSTRAI
jgi:hypothetical protein